jgi:hypothetical protein
MKLGAPLLNRVGQTIFKMPADRKGKALRMAKKQPSTFITRQSSSLNYSEPRTGPEK